MSLYEPGISHKKQLIRGIGFGVGHGSFFHRGDLAAIHVYCTRRGGGVKAASCGSGAAHQAATP